MEKIKEIKKTAEKFNYWSMNLTDASYVIEEIIRLCDEALEEK